MKRNVFIVTQWFSLQSPCHSVLVRTGPASNFFTKVTEDRTVNGKHGKKELLQRNLWWLGFHERDIGTIRGVDLGEETFGKVAEGGLGGELLGWEAN